MPEQYCSPPPGGSRESLLLSVSGTSHAVHLYISGHPLLCYLMDVLLQVSKISLVDLAGSERADSTGAKGTRLKVRHTSL